MDIDWGAIASGMPTPALVPKPNPNPFPIPGASVFGGAVPDTNMESAISPEALARNAAARGIPPPPVDVSPGTVGAALTGTTVPLPSPRQQPGAPMDITSEAQRASAAAPEAKPGNPLMDAFKGVKAPANPEIQRIASPATPKPSTAIKGGEIIALLQSLAQGKQGGLDLPSTLGQALLRK